ncbi:hypothetical protein GCM10027405_28450 [Arthrobacter alkaliphilus]
MLRVFVTASKPPPAFPLANEPGKGYQFGCQVGRDFDGHSIYLSGPEGTSGTEAAGVLLLAFEETVDDKTSEPGHREAGQAEEDEEEDFKCKYGHDAILTARR